MIGVETALPIRPKKMASGLKSPLCLETRELRVFQGIGGLLRLLKSLEDISFFQDKGYSKVRKIQKKKKRYRNKKMSKKRKTKIERGGSRMWILFIYLWSLVISSGLG